MRKLICLLLSAFAGAVALACPTPSTEEENGVTTTTTYPSEIDRKADDMINGYRDDVENSSVNKTIDRLESDYQEALKRSGGLSDPGDIVVNGSGSSGSGSSGGSQKDHKVFNLDPNGNTDADVLQDWWNKMNGGPNIGSGDHLTSGDLTSSSDGPKYGWTTGNNTSGGSGTSGGTGGGSSGGATGGVAGGSRPPALAPGSTAIIGLGDGRSYDYNDIVAGLTGNSGTTTTTTTTKPTGNGGATTTTTTTDGNGGSTTTTTTTDGNGGATTTITDIDKNGNGTTTTVGQETDPSGYTTNNVVYTISGIGFSPDGFRRASQTYTLSNPGHSCGMGWNGAYTSSTQDYTVTFSVEGTLPEGVTFDASTRSVSVAAEHGEGSFKVILTIATPAGKVFGVIEATIVVPADPQRPQDVTLTARADEPFEYKLGASAVITSGTLPAGLTFADGVISGTPTLVGTSKLTFSDGVYSGISLTITISPYGNICSVITIGRNDDNSMTIRNDKTTNEDGSVTETNEISSKKGSVEITAQTETTTKHYDVSGPNGGEGTLETVTKTVIEKTDGEETKRTTIETTTTDTHPSGRVTVTVETVVKDGNGGVLSTATASSTTTPPATGNDGSVTQVTTTIDTKGNRVDKTVTTTEKDGKTVVRTEYEQVTTGGGTETREPLGSEEVTTTGENGKKETVIVKTAPDGSSTTTAVSVTDDGKTATEVTEVVKKDSDGKLLDWTGEIKTTTTGSDGSKSETIRKDGWRVWNPRTGNSDISDGGDYFYLGTDGKIYIYSKTGAGLTMKTMTGSCIDGMRSQKSAHRKFVLRKNADGSVAECSVVYTNAISQSLPALPSVTLKRKSKVDPADQSKLTGITYTRAELWYKINPQTDNYDAVQAGTATTLVAPAWHKAAEVTGAVLDATALNAPLKIFGAVDIPGAQQGDTILFLLYLVDEDGSASGEQPTEGERLPHILLPETKTVTVAGGSDGEFAGTSYTSPYLFSIVYDGKKALK